MRTLLVGLAAAAALLTSACIVIDDNTSSGPGPDGWSGRDAAPFDAAMSGCVEAHDLARDVDACMAAKGWTRK